MRLRPFLKTIQSIRMNDAERERLHAHVAAFIENHPVRVEDRSRPVWREYFSILNVRPMPMIAVMLIAVLLVSGGTAAAAEASLPGDLFYPVKLKVTEEVRAAFALSPEAKASWASTRAERRLSEAEALAQSENVDESLARLIESNFEAQAATVQKIAIKLESSGKNNDAVIVRSRLESSLNAHGDILIKMGSSVTPSAGEFYDRLLMKIADSLELTSDERDALEETLVQETSRSEASVSAHVAVADAKISAASEIIAKSSASTETKKTAEKRLEAAKEKLAEAKEKLSEKADEAVHLASESMRIAQEAIVIVRAGAQSRISIQFGDDNDDSVSVTITETGTATSSINANTNTNASEREIKKRTEEFEKKIKESQDRFTERREKLKERLDERRSKKESDDDELEIEIEIESSSNRNNNANANSNRNSNTNRNTNVNTNSNTNLNVNVNGNANSNVNSNSNGNTNNNTDANQNENRNGDDDYDDDEDNDSSSSNSEINTNINALINIGN